MSNPPQHIANAMGAIIMYGLGQGFDVDAGFFMESPDMSVGDKPNDTPLESWRVEVRRIAKPGRGSDVVAPPVAQVDCRDPIGCSHDGFCSCGS